MREPAVRQAPAKSKKATTIRVVDVRRDLVDPVTAGLEELEIILNTSLEIPALEPYQDAVLAFLDIARELQGPLAPLLPRPPSSTETLDAILVRELLANPAVRPIISARGPAATAERVDSSPTVIHTRPATRVRAVDSTGGDIAIAAEEPINVAGFAIDPYAAGSAVINATGGGVFLGNSAYATSGTYSSALFAASGPVSPPEYIREPTSPSDPLEKRLQKRGFKTVSIGDPPRDIVNALLMQIQIAVSFYFSGAAASIALARVMAAINQVPGTSRKLLALFNHPPLHPRDAAVPLNTWRDKLANERLQYLISRLARFEPINNDDGWVYDLTPLNALYRVGALGIYLYALTEGRESMKIDDFVERLAIRHTKAQKLALIEHAFVLAAAQARIYVIIVEDKFGNVRSSKLLNALSSVQGSRSQGAPGGSLALPSDSVQVNDPNAVLELLSKREREVVTTEYANRQKEWKASATNKCPHVRHAHRLRSATSSRAAMTALAELSKYFKPDRKKRSQASGAAELEWLLCTNCGFRALCPHVRERIQLESRRASYNEIRTRLQKYAVKIRREAQSGTDMYYCRICSEQISDASEDRNAEQLGRFGNLDSGLRTKIWVVALNAAPNIRFPTPTDERQFANTAASVIYPLLMETEEVIIKKGRRRKIQSSQDDEDEIDPRTMLYIILFVYAYILNLVQNTQKARSQAVSFVGVKAGARMSAYADQMLRLVAERHRGIISQIEDVTAEYIAARFTGAFRLIRGEAVSGLDRADPEEELAIQTTTIDPIYRYAATVARVAGDLPIGRPSGPVAARREFETVLGASLPGIVKLARNSARNPELAPLYVRRTGVEVPSGGTLDHLLKDPRVNLYAKMYEPNKSAAGSAAIDAFHAIAEAANIPAPGIRHWVGAGASRRAKSRAKSRAKASRPKRTGPRPEDTLALAERGYFFESYRLFAMYTKSIVDNKAEELYQRELAKVRRSERGLRVARAIVSLKSYYDFEFDNSMQFKPTSVAITSIYDEDGIRHEWGNKATYVFTSPEVENPIKIEGGVAAVKAARLDGKITPVMTLVDLICPICGVYASKTDTLDEAKTEANVRATSEIDSFFVFFESRCPEGDLHDWGSGSTCVKCGLEVAVLKSVGGQISKNSVAREYYKKYFDKFSSERQIVRSLATKTAKTTQKYVPPTETIDWKPDYTLVVKAAELAGVTPATIEAIGAMEGREYENIVEGLGVPPPPTAPSDPRIYTGDAEVRRFLGDYGTLRNYNRVAKPPSRITELLVAAGVPKPEYNTLADVLPDVGAGYRNQFTTIMRTRSPAMVYTFTIQSLCRMLLEVATIKSPSAEWATRLGQMFAKQELEAILHSQKLFSKPGSFSWSVFDDANMNVEGTQDQAGDVGEDVLEELLVNVGEEAAEDPYSGDHIDYDVSENNPNNE